MLNVGIELLSMTESVGVCVERVPGTAAIASTSAGGAAGASSKSKSALQFDTRLTDPTLMELDKDRTTVTCVGGGQQLWRTALINYPMTAGVHRWEVLVARSSNMNVMIGVSERPPKFSGQYIGQTHGYAYFGARPGYFWHQGKCPASVISSSFSLQPHDLSAI